MITTESHRCNTKACTFWARPSSPVCRADLPRAPHAQDADTKVDVAVAVANGDTTAYPQNLAYQASKTLRLDDDLDGLSASIIPCILHECGG